mmetsp:Transcript_39170/g.92178  ORF Transcript_39170/g.92178 Transcript_39170/m.92178 type:complete len:296 (+) Transcript_39170:787-1674(+)
MVSRMHRCQCHMIGNAITGPSCLAATSVRCSSSPVSAASSLKISSARESRLVVSSGDPSSGETNMEVAAVTRYIARLSSSAAHFEAMCRCCWFLMLIQGYCPWLVWIKSASMSLSSFRWTSRTSKVSGECSSLKMISRRSSRSIVSVCDSTMLRALCSNLSSMPTWRSASMESWFRSSTCVIVPLSSSSICSKVCETFFFSAFSLACTLVSATILQMTPMSMFKIVKAATRMKSKSNMPCMGLLLNTNRISTKVSSKERICWKVRNDRGSVPKCSYSTLVWLLLLAHWVKMMAQT